MTCRYEDNLPKGTLRWCCHWCNRLSMKNPCENCSKNEGHWLSDEMCKKWGYL